VSAALRASLLWSGVALVVLIVAIAAIARKLTVSIWYMLRGLFAPLKQIDASLRVKLAKIATAIGVEKIRHLGYKSKAAFIEEKIQWLLNPA